MSAGLTARVLDPRTDPEPADWAGFVRAERLHLPWEYRLMGIESHAAAHPTLLALVRDGERIVAAFAVMLRRGRLGLRWLEVHQPWMAGFPGWAFAAGLDPAGRRRAVAAFERAACRYAGPACLGLLYKHVPADQPLVTGRGRPSRETVASAVLPNRFTSVQDWIGSLRRKRRSSMRGYLRRVAADPDLVVRFEPQRCDLDAAQLADRLYRHRASFGSLRYDSRSPVSAEYLAAVVGRPDVHTITYHDRAGRLLAFGILLDHPAMPFFQHWAALRPDDGGRRYLYFDAYARAVGRIIELDREAMAVGRGMVELKVALGCTTQPRLVVVAPRPLAGLA